MFFDYHSWNSQGILVHVLVMNPAILLLEQFHVAASYDEDFV